MTLLNYKNLTLCYRRANSTIGLWSSNFNESWKFLSFTFLITSDLHRHPFVFMLSLSISRNISLPLFPKYKIASITKTGRSKTSKCFSFSLAGKYFHCFFNLIILFCTHSSFWSLNPEISAPGSSAVCDTRPNSEMAQPHIFGSDFWEKNFSCKKKPWQSTKSHLR